MQLVTPRSNEEIQKEVEETLRKHGFRFQEHNPDYEGGPTLDHPAIFGVLSLATMIQWGSEMPWYVHNGRLYFTLANTEPSVDLADEFWHDKVIHMYVAALLDCYDALPYPKKA